jgi:hypothetical protein
MSLHNLLEKGVLSRIFILWLVSMSVLGAVFAVGAYTHQDAWVNVQPVEQQTGWSVFWFILRNNFLILGLIALGNLFVRFGAVTPGLLILAIQLVTIGWTAERTASWNLSRVSRRPIPPSYILDYGK